MRGLLQPWTRSSRILTSKEESVWRNKKAQKQDRFLRGRQIAYLDLRTIPGHWSPWFCRKLHRPVHCHCQSSKWWYSGIRFQVGRNFIVHDENPTWWRLGRIVQIKNTRVRETQDRIVWPGDSSEESWTWLSQIGSMVRRSIEQEIRNKNFGARSGNFEKNAVVKNQGTKQRVQRILGDCWQWKTNGQCVKGDNCSFRHDTNKRGKSSPSNPSPNSLVQQSERKSSRTRSPRGKSPSGRMSRWPCKDYLRGTCNNSFCERWHPPECLFYKTKSGCRFGEKVLIHTSSGWWTADKKV